jgi:peptide/nickel transport system substrate-binding protein
MLTTRDVEFDINLLLANQIASWEYYPGWWMADITSIAYPSGSQFSITFNQTYNSTWILDNALSELVPMPQYAWDRTSANGPIGNYDKTTAGAKAVYNFLNKQSDTLSTWDTNPLWQVVDGPFKLKRNDGFSPTTGLVVMVPNPDYSGPVKPKIARLEELPFTSASAEIDAVLGGEVDYGYLPYGDLHLKDQLEKSGYKIDSWHDWAISGINLTYPNRAVGHILSQLYIRQALQRLINQPQYIKDIFDGYATPTYSFVPAYPKTDYATTYATDNPYSYDPKAARNLLTDHGWKVVPGGLSTCADAGAGANQCGAGISKGAALSLNIIYPTGALYYTEEMEAMQSSFRTEGIQLQLKSAPYNTVLTDVYSCDPATGSGCEYPLGYIGSPYWIYFPVYFPSGDAILLDSDLIYSGNPAFVQQAVRLVSASHQPGLVGLHEYENYVAKELPMLWVPNTDWQISVISKKLKGITAQDVGLNIYPEDWTLDG